MAVVSSKAIMPPGPCGDNACYAVFTPRVLTVDVLTLSRLLRHRNGGPVTATGPSVTIELGRQFEREIFEQPDAWERIARSDASARLASALAGKIVLVGSGSSLFAAQLGAIALRRRAIDAIAVAATEARGDHRAFEGSTVVALSQSGRSTDVLRALDALRPAKLVAVTNTASSPLADRADLTIDVGAGPELAVPATKSVSCTIAILLTAASLLAHDRSRDPAVLRETAQAIQAWLRDRAGSVVTSATQIARCSGIAI